MELSDRVEAERRKTKARSYQSRSWELTEAWEEALAPGAVDQGLGGGEGEAKGKVL